MYKYLKRKIKKYLNKKDYYHKSQIEINNYKITKILKNILIDSDLKLKTELGELSLADYLAVLISSEYPIMFTKIER
ncbi:MAG: hypothetical protein V1901_04315 [Patescibacteria group bacterium]